MDFSKEELKRYNRHIILKDFGIEGQRRLKAAKVLVVGAGGLGSSLLMYLAAAGVGTIGIVDFDIIEDSNLQRQVLFDTSVLGQSKANEAKNRLQALNPYIEINVHAIRLTAENALSIIKEYDVVADGTDNFPTRYLINDACVILDKPNVYASIHQFEGQVAVFNYKNEKGENSPNYRDLFPTPPPPEMIPNCAEAGVIGVLGGIIGSLQANEVIKVISGVGEPLSGRLLIFDALDLTTRIMRFRKNPSVENIVKLIDYEQFCGNTTEEKKVKLMKEVTVQELKALQDAGADFQLIDVRESYEYEIVNINGELIPLGEIMSSEDKISRDKKVVIHCRSGARSGSAILALEAQYGFDNLYNLKGGVLAYAREIDNSLATY